MNSGVPVSDLLRRVKLAAVKLGLGAVEDWVEHELKGYQGKPPEYRKVHGRPMGRNPYRGWMPLGGNTESISWMPNAEPVSSLEALLAKANKGSTFQVAYPDKLAAMLDQQNGVRGWNYALEVSPSELSRILDHVRTLVFEWALNLEKAGVMGSETSFDNEEKDKAQKSSTVINIGHIGSFVGNLGQGNTSGDIESSGINADQVGSIISQLRSHRSELAQAGVDGARLEERLLALEQAIAANNRGALRGLLTDVRNSLSGAAGNLIATGAVNLLNAILGTGVPST